MMTIDQFMQALERAWSHAVPGREAATRDALLCELHRRLEHEPRQIEIPLHAEKFFGLRLVVRG
jgi:hypothetical protein